MISKAKQKKILSVCEYAKMFKIPADTKFTDNMVICMYVSRCKTYSRQV